MAQTLTITPDQQSDPQYRMDGFIARGVKMRMGSVALGSYVTGGIPMVFSMNSTSIVIVPPQAGYNFSYDNTNEKLLAYVSGGDTNDVQVEVADNTDLSSLTDLPYVAFGW